MRRAVAAAVVATVALLGCGDDDDGTSGHTTTTVEDGATTSTTDATTTTGGPTPPPTAGTPLPADPEAYATAFIETWERGDMTGASVLGTPEAVATLFAFESGGPGTWSLVMCEGAAGSTYCTFSAGGDPTVVVRVANDVVAIGQNQAVTEVIVES